MKKLFSKILILSLFLSSTTIINPSISTAKTKSYVVRGTIAKITNSYLYVKSKKANKKATVIKIYFSSSTEIELEKEKSSKKKLRKNDRVGVRYKKRSKDNKRIASMVNVEGALEIEGTITAIDTSAKTVTIQDTDDNGQSSKRW